MVMSSVFFCLIAHMTMQKNSWSNSQKFQGYFHAMERNINFIFRSDMLNIQPLLPTFASNRSQLMRCADAALYEIKLHGKNGCMAYKNGLQLGARKQLGFALKDISEHLPGAFIIYRADKTDDELFYANHEFLRMTGYKNMDELFRLAQKSFRNLIREDEQQKIESSIWEQIDSGNENDYIHFHLRKADGSYLSVLDHGRIVNSQQYGRVFYVLFTDWEDMHIHYGDKFSE